ncbi:MAG: choice-of-anchor tandem repeat NxxGxxAF-containing protein [Planctomycetota bacterium]
MPVAVTGFAVPGLGPEPIQTVSGPGVLNDGRVSLGLAYPPPVGSFVPVNVSVLGPVGAFTETFRDGEAFPFPDGTTRPIVGSATLLPDGVTRFVLGQDQGKTDFFDFQFGAWLERDGVKTPLVVPGDPLPEPSGELLNSILEPFGSLPLSPNGAGQLAFQASTATTFNGPLLLADGTGLTPWFTLGAALPGRTDARFFDPVGGGVRSFALNDAGGIVFTAPFEFIGSPIGQTGVFVWDNGMTRSIVLSEDVAPGTGGLTFSNVGASLLDAPPTSDAQGRIAFGGAVVEPFTINLQDGVWFYEGEAAGSRLLGVEGGAVPGVAEGEFTRIDRSRIRRTSGGRVAFYGEWDPPFVFEGLAEDAVAGNGPDAPPPGFGSTQRDSEGWFVDDGTDTRLVVAAGDPLPNDALAISQITNSAIAEPGEGFVFNDRGQFAVRAVSEGFFPGGDGTGIWFGEPGEELIEVIRNGQTLDANPDPGVTDLREVNQVYIESAMNDRGQFLFRAFLDGQAEGLFLFTPPGFSDALTGDFDNSGQVSQGDLNAVLNNWGSDAGLDDGSTAFASSVVDQEELNAVLNNWGASTSPVIVAVDRVPEPGIAILIPALATVLKRSHAAS